MNHSRETNIWREVVRRFRFKYRVSVLNENTLEEAWHVRLSRLSLFVWSGVLLVVVFLIMAAIIVFTPLRNYLPGAQNISVALDLERQTERIDSLELELEHQTRYVDILRAIVSGELETDSVATLDSVDVAQLKMDILNPLRFERQFREAYEEQESYSIYGTTLDTEKLVFFKPVEGVVTVDNATMLTTIAAPEGTPVMSVLDGKVVVATYTVSDLWTVAIQHAAGYTSVYSNLSAPFVGVGAAVKAGQVIATVPAAASVNFCLWHDNVISHQVYYED